MNRVMVILKIRALTSTLFRIYPRRAKTTTETHKQGCVIIFLSNFLALLIKADAAGEEHREVLGGLLVAINLGLILAVVLTSWFATKQIVADARAEDNAFLLAKTIATNEFQASTRRLQTRESRGSSILSPVGSPVVSALHAHSGGGPTPYALRFSTEGRGWSVGDGFRIDDGFSNAGSEGNKSNGGGSVGLGEGEMTTKCNGQ